jgi:hypothetical protein
MPYIREEPILTQLTQMRKWQLRKNKPATPVYEGIRFVAYGILTF